VSTPAKPLDPERARRLAQLLDGVAAVANRVKPFARATTLLALIAGAALVMELHYGAHLGAVALAIAAVVLLVPGAILAMLWLLLSDLGDLPGQVRRVYGGLREVARGEPGGAAAVGGVFRMGGSLREAASLAVDAGGLAGAITGVMLLANPLFLMLVAISLATAGILALAAAVGALFFL